MVASNSDALMCGWWLATVTSNSDALDCPALNPGIQSLTHCPIQQLRDSQFVQHQLHNDHSHSRVAVPLFR